VAVYNEKAFCASGAVAFNIAHMALASGAHDVALVVGVEKMSSREGAGRPLTSDGKANRGLLRRPTMRWPRAGTWRPTAPHGSRSPRLR
jgi:acetyl-CoA acetyltransferase